MGLDTTHDCWHGGYGAFQRWRQKLAEVVGIPLQFMQGFYPDPVWGLDSIAEALTGTATVYAHNLHEYHALLPIRWDILKPDILHVLLHHSDCDGEIAAKDCAPMADRLTELLPLLPDEDVGGHIGNWRAKTQAFIDGLRMAASRGEAVEFH